MNRTVHSALLVIAGFAISFICLLLLGGYIFDGEAAMGIGILWAYSIPAYLLLGILLGRLSYGWYSIQSATLVQTTSLLGLALSVAVLGPSVTYLVLWSRRLFW
jgi:hypothetical protein